jgi:hypothetical protein
MPRRAAVLRAFPACESASRDWHFVTPRLCSDHAPPTRGDRRKSAVSLREDTRMQRPQRRSRARSLALAILAIATVSLAVPARAQTYDPNYPVCLQIYQGGIAAPTHRCHSARRRHPAARRSAWSIRTTARASPRRARSGCARIDIWDPYRRRTRNRFRQVAISPKQDDQPAATPRATGLMRGAGGCRLREVLASRRARTAPARSTEMFLT